MSILHNPFQHIAKNVRLVHSNQYAAAIRALIDGDFLLPKERSHLIAIGYCVGGVSV